MPLVFLSRCPEHLQHGSAYPFSCIKARSYVSDSLLGEQLGEHLRYELLAVIGVYKLWHSKLMKDVLLEKAGDFSRCGLRHRLQPDEIGEMV